MIYTLAGTLPMASGIILLPFYIAYLPTDAYGALSIYLAFSILVQLLVTYSFDSSLYVHYHEFKHDSEKLSAFISSVFIFILLLGAGVAIFLALTGKVIFDVIFTKEAISFYPYGFISVGVGVFQAIFKIKVNLLITSERPQVFLWANVASFSVIAITTILGLHWYPGSLIGPLGGRLVAAFLSAGWAGFTIFREFGFHVKSPWQFTSFSYNAYTFIYQLQQWAINYMDRFLILFFMPLSTVGIYDFALKCVVPIELILNGLNATITPKVISLSTGDPAQRPSVQINRYYYGLTSVVMLMICVSIFFIPVIIDLFVKKSAYAQSVQYLPYLALIYIFRAMRLYFAIPFNIYKYMQQLSVINFVTSAIKIILMIILIKRFNIYGVIISAYVASLIEIFLLWFNLRMKYKMDFNSFKLIWIPILLFGLVLLIEPILGATFSVAAHAGYGIFCACMLLLAYRNEWKLLSTLTYR
jgi:O-antigen/teichoic acid export membrane protein